MICTEFKNSREFSKIKSYPILKKEYIFNYINYSIENDLEINFIKKNITNLRHHLWDIRTIHDTKKILGSPLFFLPELLKSNMVIEINMSNPDEFKKFKLYTDEIRKLYAFENKDNSFKIISLIFYLSNYNDSKVLELYSKGKILYNQLYQIFYKFYKTEINKISFNKDKTVDAFSKLIQKQLNKSIFSLNLYKFFRIYTDTINGGIFDNVYDLSISLDIRKTKYYYNFEVASFFSDVYSIARMFKNDFDPKKNSRNDLCDKTAYFKNMIYVGGNLHATTLINFIMFYFDKKINLSKISKESNMRCIEFDSPVEFFND